MIRNYLKTAIRSLLKSKGFTIVNIAGLTIGMIGCLCIGLFVWDEMQFDRDVPAGEKIYRLYSEWPEETGTSFVTPVPPAFATFLQHSYGEVDTTVRILMAPDKHLVEFRNVRLYEEKALYVEPAFLSFFGLRLVSGHPASALSGPDRIVISQQMAQRFFGSADPVGKIILVDKSPFTVRGVLAPLSPHFHLQFSYLMPLASAGIPQERMEKWTWNQFCTYIRLKAGGDNKKLEAKFQQYVARNIVPTLTSGSHSIPHLQRLRDIHLKSSGFVYDNAVRGNIMYVKALSLIALFVLVIAGFNFVNLATARSFKRAKEIGVRKVIGAGRKQLILQFLSETVLLAMAGLILSLAVTMSIIPTLNRFTGKAIQFNPLTDPLLLAGLLMAGILVGLLAGLYPAFVLSGFQPIKTLKGMRLLSGPAGGGLLRKSLVVLQFTLSVILIVSTFVVFRQTRYLDNKELGFRKDQVLAFPVQDSLQTNTALLESFKNELRNIPGVQSVTSGYGLPGDRFAGDGVILGNETTEHPVNLFVGDHDYIKTLGLNIIAGRDFSRDMRTDVTDAFIINETAVKEFGYGTPEHALGKPISWNEWAPLDSTKPVKHGKVIGVVRDFHYKSLHEKVGAAVIELYPQVTYKVAAHVNSANIRNTIASINAIWNRYCPGYPLDYNFLDESYDQMYKTEEKLSALLSIFTVLSVIVGCLGLFALSAFSAEQRVKEIGIRKVLGANVTGIVGLLARNFLLLVLIACVVASPIAWWAMSSWLNDFPYRVSLGAGTFIIATMAALLIALVTVSFQSIRAAMTNPVRSLRMD